MSLARLKIAALLEARSRAAGSARLEPDGIYIPEQLAVIRSRHDRKALRCGRRSGKSVSIAGFLTDRATTAPFTNAFYLTLTLKNAKRIIWPELVRLNKEFKLGGIPLEAEGVMRYPHLGPDVHIYLGGCKDTTEIEKWRGIPGKAWVIDEMQSFPQRIIRPLMKDAIQPASMDQQGEILLSGTPGPVCAGYWYDVDAGALSEEWEHHRWTVRENTKLPARVRGKSVEEILARILKENKWTAENPTFLREYLNHWVQDFDALVFKYLVERNGFEEVPDGQWHYVIGVDFGFEDADAFAVLGWRDFDKNVYLVEEFTRPKQGITEPAQQIQALIDKYKPLKVVADLGALGKKIGEEIRRRFGIPVEAADKHRKLEHIALLNDAMLGQRFFARPTGVFAEDAAVVQWDQDKRAVGTLEIADDFHSDITDAVLYAYRACYGWIQGEPPPKTKTDGEEYALRLLRIAARERAESGEYE